MSSRFSRNGSLGLRHDESFLESIPEQTGFFKRQTFLLLEEPSLAGRIGRVIAAILALLILTNALLVFVVFEEFVSDEVHDALFIFDVVSTVIFFIEYLGRLWTADLLYPRLGAVQARIRYMCSLLGVIDLLSFLPFLGVMFGALSYQTLNTLRVIRAIRLFKISRYMHGLGVISRVLHERARELVAAFAVLFLLIVSASVMMFQFENPVQPEAFDSIFTGIYWAVTTITSTGYGDLVPLTPGGRCVGTLTMLLSIGIVAIPAGIFTAGFLDEMSEERRMKGAANRGSGAGRGVEGEHGKAPLVGEPSIVPVCSDEAHVRMAAAAQGAWLYCPVCGEHLGPAGVGADDHIPDPPAVAS